MTAMTAMTYALAGLTLVILAQTVVTWRLSTRIRAAERLDRRLSHFAEALALLTDTTETGLANVATELEQAGRRRGSRPAATANEHRSASRSTRPKATARRIATATRGGTPVGEIAAAEGMSESEVLLHLGMSAGTRAKGSVDGSVRI
jgi:hypothetical protein